jgi:radical SAM superfamily enzyme YgiQ (UPF0313 family)
MKVTLIQPRYFNIWEALGLAYIGAFAKKHHHGKLDVHFFQGYFDDDDTILEESKTSDVVAFSCTTPVFAGAVRLARRLKSLRPEVRTVFGGFHPSAVPQECLEEASVDQVVVGEGEVAFQKILDGDRSPVVYGDRFADLSTIFPDRDLILNHRTIDLCEQMTGKRITSFQSVRVCPFRCAFCSERTVTGVFNRRTNPIRERDPKHLLEEIRWATDQYELDYFKFADATWNTSAASTEKVIGFCEEKIRIGFTLPWEAMVHAAFATKEMLKLMKAAGCRMINVGCESGSQRILNDMRKSVTVEKIKAVFRWGRELGLERRGFFILGMPNETEADIRLTERLVEEIDPDVFGVTILCPYPGSDFYDPENMRGYDWFLADEYTNPYWRTPHLSNAQLKLWQKRFMDRFRSKLAWHNTLISEAAK